MSTVASSALIQASRSRFIESDGHRPPIPILGHDDSRSGQRHPNQDDLAAGRAVQATDYDVRSALFLNGTRVPTATPSLIAKTLAPGFR